MPPTVWTSSPTSISEPLDCRAACALRCWGRMKKKYPSTPIARSGSRVSSGLLDDFELAATSAKWASAGLSVMGEILGPVAVAKGHLNAWGHAFWGAVLRSGGAAAPGVGRGGPGVAAGDMCSDPVTCVRTPRECAPTWPLPPEQW